jgi:hypothetical protein
MTKRLASVQLILGTVLLTVAVPAGARGNGGGHGGHSHCASHSRGHSSGMGSSTGHSLASGSQESHGFVNCPVQLREGAFCPFHAGQVGGTFYPAEGPTEGPPESDLGPWWIFLFLGRGAVRGVRWLIGW